MDLFRAHVVLASVEADSVAVVDDVDSGKHMRVVEGRSDSLELLSELNAALDPVGEMDVQFAKTRR